MSDVAFQNLTNHFLIAMLGMVDPSFAESLTLICDHNADGALGIIVNRPTGLLMSEIFRQVGISNHGEKVQNRHSVYSGGPVSQERGFVLNSGEHCWESSLSISSGIQLATSPDILVAIAEDRGPSHFLVALGYAGWGAGQLEDEISQNAWLTCKADPDIIFNTSYHLRLNAAANSLGVNLNLISDQVGHA
ncbi:hypothetical protein ACH42_04860 [Endozoicomonas sp. (ex Bugula neritina AB1)]|nr:hypothetical protein ACH42_04860 [Endozoicomonas sp. (ex Bugula neritina AB1)]